MKSADTEGSGRLIRIRVSDCARMEKETDRNLTGKTAAEAGKVHAVSGFSGGGGLKRQETL